MHVHMAKSYTREQNIYMASKLVTEKRRGKKVKDKIRKRKIKNKK